MKFSFSGCFSYFSWPGDSLKQRQTENRDWIFACPFLVQKPADFLGEAPVVLLIINKYTSTRDSGY